MATGIEDEWLPEDLPADAWIFRRAHSTFHTRSEPRVPNRGAFKDPGDELSVFWAKYTTAKATRHYGSKPPEEYAVLAIHLSDIPMEELGLTIVHTPIRDADGNRLPNRAHCDIKGAITLEVRDILFEKSQVIIPIEKPTDYDPPNPE